LLLLPLFAFFAFHHASPPISSTCDNLSRPGTYCSKEATHG
jgi:hypothetical protein